MPDNFEETHHFVSIIDDADAHYASVIYPGTDTKAVVFTLATTLEETGVDLVVIETRDGHVGVNFGHLRSIGVMRCNADGQTREEFESAKSSDD